MAKDQSYVLGVLDERQLAHAMFPLGDTLTTKDEIRAEAERRGLAVAKKPDSHDICFIADGDTQGFLAGRLGTAEGDIVDESGAKVGTHEGAYGFTIGQRKGLRIGHPGRRRQAALRPRHLPGEQHGHGRPGRGPRRHRADRDQAPLVRRGPRRPRHLHRPAARPRRRDRGDAPSWSTATLQVTFTEPVRGVAPGQAIVLYDGTRVVGSATIATTERSRPAAHQV